MVFDGLGGEVVTIDFPMVQESVTYTLPRGLWAKGGLVLRLRQYRIRFAGNTAVGIFPRCENPKCSTYLRSHYGSDKAPMKEVTHYVAPFAID